MQLLLIYGILCCLELGPIIIKRFQELILRYQLSMNYQRPHPQRKQDKTELRFEILAFYVEAII
jgi:hypothetical protein